jgi:hypothetical protein
MEKINNFNNLSNTNNISKTDIIKIDYKKLLNFDPTSRDGLIMFGLYIAIIMFILKKYAIGVCFGCISIFLFFTKKEKVKEPCRESTTDNPYQNLLQENDGLKACPTDKKIQQKNFNENLYRNETDLFNRKSMQGLYYTVEDYYPNNISELIKSMDSRGRCKSEGINCEYVSFFLN